MKNDKSGGAQGTVRSQTCRSETSLSKAVQGDGVGARTFETYGGAGDKESIGSENGSFEKLYCNQHLNLSTQRKYRAKVEGNGDGHTSLLFDSNRSTEH